ncbi:MAG: hypothetical protein ACRDHP_11735 [Ktedonobacterales bacterium]
MATTFVTQAESEIVDFLSRRPTPDEIVAFHLSQEASDRAYELIALERERRLSNDEQHELDIYLYLEHFMGMIKIEAHRQLGAQAI